jgi:quaternary ammonium compound-resistance protein SugE
LLTSSVILQAKRHQQRRRDELGYSRGCRAFEVGWAIGLKYTQGFTRFWPTVWTVLSMIVSLGLLGLAMKALPVGTAYSVWVGVGAIGTIIFGIVLFEEPASAGRLISVALILAGMVGLKLST